MTRRRRLLLATSIVAALLAPASSRGADDLDAKVEALLQAVEGLAGYAAAGRRPVVRMLPQHVIEERVCDEPCNVSAAYLPREDEIWLAGNLDPVHDPIAGAALLHELVHYLQQGHPRFAALRPCERDREKEREAYAVQNAYLAGIGRDERVVFYESEFDCVDGEFAQPR